MISRDISELVRQCLDESRPRAEGSKKPAGSIIDTILQNEIVKFTSVDFEDPGARPLSPDDLSPSPGRLGCGARHGRRGGDFIDPRGWASERMTPVVGIDQIEGQLHDDGRRDTVADHGSIVQQAMEARDTVVTRGALPFPTSSAVGLTGPTPGPESLANVLEPGMSPAPAPVPAAAAARGREGAPQLSHRRGDRARAPRHHHGDGRRAPGRPPRRRRAVTAPQH